MPRDNDEAEVGSRAAKALRNENSGNRSQTRAVIQGRGIQRDFRQYPSARADRKAVRDMGKRG